MNVHFIAIGGAIMHNLAICLQNMGHSVSGSDDNIFDPAKSNLEKVGLMPAKIGFDVAYISKDIDAIILGMHAKQDNVELKKAQDLGIRIYSFPEFIYEQSKTKIRIVVGGSHGKTTTTAMIMHVMRTMNFDFDYLVGSSLAGFDLSVKLSNAPYIVLEGDEYLSSPIEMTSKFHYYKPNIAIITGIAWDHVNVFPTWESYIETFNTFLKNLSSDAQAILFEQDKTLQEIAKNASCQVQFYNTPDYKIKDEKTFIIWEGLQYPLAFFGKHNIENLESARIACEAIGIKGEDFFEAIASFTGTAKRLEVISNKNKIVAFRDFAHSPSKLEATLNSVKEQYEHKKLIACMELHTFSSTNKDFLSEYQGSMQQGDLAIIYMSAKAFELKGKDAISDETIHETFEQENIHVCRNPKELLALLNMNYSKDAVFLFMSSGSFDGIDWVSFLNNESET
jgi:UDP-N-acetylmuramate: L-alanyl-gamma-D-glutamyl-meso-diaminopimelate ligase